MTTPAPTNADVIRYWHETAGPTWVELDARIAPQLLPFGERAMERADLAPGSRVLDIGCGTGHTTREIARRVGPSGAVTGLDVSEPMLAAAREATRAEGLDHVTYELADAQTATLPQAAFDRLYSRFGVMFFSDPEAAFTNLRRALRPGARLSFVCWRALTENPWMAVPLAAAASVVSITPPPPGAPGPMAFADDGRVRRILEGAGFDQVAIDPHDDLVTMSGGTGGLDEALTFLLRIGPAAAALREAGPEAKPAVAAAIRAALAPYYSDEEGLRLAGAVWLVTATSP